MGFTKFGNPTIIRNKDGIPICPICGVRYRIDDSGVQKCACSEQGQTEEVPVKEDPLPE